MNNEKPDWVESFCQRHRLPETYALDARDYFQPLLEQLCLLEGDRQQTLIVGINGAQGTGKSTLGDFLVTGVAEQAGLNAVSLSLDDLYLSKAGRERLAGQIHPLLKIRGVPGTHDLHLAELFFDQLFNQDEPSVQVPRFDKSVDDRQNKELWPWVDKPIDLLVLEGWCVGCLQQPDSALDEPLNALEREEDANGAWRKFVNRSLIEYQLKLWSRLDCLVMLQAPNFEQVYEWRSRQEEKLVQRTGTPTELSNADAMQRFISHYERLTRWMLQEMPQRADWVFELDQTQRIVRNHRHG